MKRYNIDTLLTDIIENSNVKEYKLLSEYFSGISLKDVQNNKSIDYLRDRYNNGTTGPSNVRAFVHLENAFDSFVKEYLLDYLYRPSKCEADNCYWDTEGPFYDSNGKESYKGDVYGYTCFYWLCKEDYFDPHSRVFTCGRCGIEQCLCKLTTIQNNIKVCVYCQH